MDTGEMVTSRVFGMFAEDRDECFEFQLACFVHPIAIASDGSIHDESSFPWKILWTIGFNHACILPLNNTVSISFGSIPPKNSFASLTILDEIWSQRALLMVT